LSLPVWIFQKSRHLTFHRRRPQAGSKTGSRGWPWVCLAPTENRHCETNVTAVCWCTYAQKAAICRGLKMFRHVREEEERVLALCVLNIHDCRRMLRTRKIHMQRWIASPKAPLGDAGSRRSLQKYVRQGQPARSTKGSRRSANARARPCLPLF